MYQYNIILLIAIFVNVQSQTVVQEDNDEAVASDNPEFISKNSTIEAKLGGSVTLSCQVNKLGDSQIIWSKQVGTNWSVLRVGDTPVAITKDNPKFKFTDQSTVLTINDIDSSDLGNYKCEIAVAGANKPTIYLNVKLEDGQKESGSERIGSGTALVFSLMWLTRIIWN